MARVHTKDVLKCCMTASGEQCVMMDSLMQQQESLATLWDLGKFTDLGKHKTQHDKINCPLIHRICTTVQGIVYEYAAFQKSQFYHNRNTPGGDMPSNFQYAVTYIPLYVW